MLLRDFKISTWTYFQIGLSFWHIQKKKLKYLKNSKVLDLPTKQLLSTFLNGVHELKRRFLGLGNNLLNVNGESA